MRSLILIIFVLISINNLCAQQLLKPSPTRFSAEVGAMASSSRRTPFWLRANQFGAIPNISPAGILRLGSSGRFSKDSTGKKWSANYSIELVGNAGPNNRLLLPEANISVNRGYFELLIGRRKEVLGLVDTTLSSGSYSWSGNALPIPKIQIGTRGFAPLHFTNDVLAINAFFAHGWFTSTDSMKNSYLHQKAVYARIGKPTWKVKLYGGVLHHAQWGGRSRYLGQKHATDGTLPSSFKDLLYVLVAQQPSGKVSKHDSLNVYGNHVGSIDFAAEIALSKWALLGYYQHPFEDKSGLVFINFPDGLYGIRIKRKPFESHRFFQINQLLFEYLNTMNQSGKSLEIGRRLYLGIDDYFNNFQYIDGWTHRHQVIGTPFITHIQDVKEKWKKLPGWRAMSIVNNQVQLLHFGLDGSFSNGAKLQTRLSFSHNYRLIRKSFGQVNQFSGMAALTWPAKWLEGGVELQAIIALDKGGLFDNAVGGWLSLKKRL
ncbi:capsule assembly Wzi family protein [Larkinella arboricola]